MDFDTLRRARRLGASDKGRQFNVGFRGIGISGAPSVSPQPDIAPPRQALPRRFQQPQDLDHAETGQVALQRKLSKQRPGLGRTVRRQFVGGQSFRLVSHAL